MILIINKLLPKGTTHLLKTIIVEAILELEAGVKEVEAMVQDF